MPQIQFSPWCAAFSFVLCVKHSKYISGAQEYRACVALCLVFGVSPARHRCLYNTAALVDAQMARLCFPDFPRHNNKKRGKLSIVQLNKEIPALPPLYLLLSPAFLGGFPSGIMAWTNGPLDHGPGPWATAGVTSTTLAGGSPHNRCVWHRSWPSLSLEVVACLRSEIRQIWICPSPSSVEIRCLLPIAGFFSLRSGTWPPYTWFGRGWCLKLLFTEIRTERWSLSTS